MTGKRFTFSATEREEDVLVDDLERQVYELYEIDKLCNRLWRQTKRFEKHNHDLVKENEYLKQRLDDVLKELYCKDRKLEELNVDIECCDNND